MDDYIKLDRFLKVITVLIIIFIGAVVIGITLLRDKPKMESPKYQDTFTPTPLPISEDLDGKG